MAAARNPNAETLLWVDERGAAFVALGMARATGEPAVLICSSGTAGANYFPAVIEASVDRVPLLICTADRPPELQETGANQTIRQADLYGESLRWQRVMPCPSAEIDPAFVLTTAAEAVHRSLSESPGPVHLNWPFREPLSPPLSPSQTHTLSSSLERWFLSGEPWTRTKRPLQTVSDKEMKALAKRLSSIKHGLLVVGRRAGAEETEAILGLAERLQWPLLVDVGSGLRFGHFSPLMIRGWDSLLRSSEWQDAMTPEFVLHLGGALVGKRWLSYTRRHRGCEHLHVHESDERLDPEHSLTERWQASVSVFASELTKALPAQTSLSAWTERWQEGGQWFATLRESRLEASPPPTPPLEPALVRELSKRWQDKSLLFVGNSMPIRDLDLWGEEEAPSVSVLANRGASGIDGLLATAIGAVKASHKPGVLLIGDLSLLHDLNSLLLLQQADVSLTVIVFNNHGGGIFGHLPVARCEDVFEEFFQTPHSFNFAPVAESLGIQCLTPTSLQEFGEAVEAAARHKGPMLIEVQTSSQHNLQWNRSFHRELEQQLLSSLNSVDAKKESV
jgi:2-succinyl-5-enolpyruvyl-6-hydroxy-3-cyclohexene-1-carboxylate synthase